jgi:hypothetical protein
MEIGVMEIGAYEIGISEVGICEIGAFEFGICEIGAYEIGAFKIGTSEISVWFNFVSVHFHNPNLDQYELASFFLANTSRPRAHRDFSR